MILVVLWLFTSGYAIPLGTYPNGQGCVVGAAMTEAQFKEQKGPTPFLYRLACVPTVMPGAAHPRDRPAYSF
jgi:hypothetical protein